MSKFDGLNAGLVNEGDVVQVWRWDCGGYPFTYFVYDTQVFNLPSDCYKATVNGKVVVDLRYEK